MTRKRAKPAPQPTPPARDEGAVGTSRLHSPDPREISIANQHPGLRLDRRAVTPVIHCLDAHAPAILGPRLASAVPEGELSLVFMTDAALAQLHADFLDDPTTTDVITFEGDPAFGNAGEICVSADTAAHYAREHRRDTAAAYAKQHRRDFSTELTLYLIHGWLHLAGHDDLQPAKKTCHAPSGSPRPPRGCESEPPAHVPPEVVYRACDSERASNPSCPHPYRPWNSDVCCP
ncbi:MAG: rRNA maturation RNase YbeY [Verrucomicrobiota bacterium]